MANKSTYPGGRTWPEPGYVADTGNASLEDLAAVHAAAARGREMGEEANNGVVQEESGQLQSGQYRDPAFGPAPAPPVALTAEQAAELGLPPAPPSKLMISPDGKLHAIDPNLNTKDEFISVPGGTQELNLDYGTQYPADWIPDPFSGAVPGNGSAPHDMPPSQSPQGQ
jgi:hypothetical protein